MHQHAHEHWRKARQLDRASAISEILERSSLWSKSKRSALISTTSGSDFGDVEQRLRPFRAWKHVLDPFKWTLAIPSQLSTASL